MVDITKIEKLMILMAKHGFDVVQAESSTEKFALTRHASQVSYTSSAAPTKHHISLENNTEEPSSPPAQESQTPVAPAKQEKSVPAGETITSPFVGTFYRSPGPDALTFVEIGSKVKKGQSLCIVEAMKLMNEIEAEVEGEIVAILVENAKPVEFGTPLFIIAPVK